MFEPVQMKRKHESCLFLVDTINVQNMFDVSKLCFLLTACLIKHAVLGTHLYDTDDVNCSWVVNNIKIDLSPLYGETMSGSDGKFAYFYCPCHNGLQCLKDTGETLDVMVDQIESQGFCNAYLAEFDINVQPSIISNTTNDYYSFNFTYTNGDNADSCINGRTTSIIWQCGQELHNIDSIQQMTSCSYQMFVSSNLTCVVNLKK